jgi:hypothetical protein
MEDDYCSFGGCGYLSGCEDEDRHSDGVSMRLILDIGGISSARNGCMPISCMNLRLDNGIWSPFNPYDDSTVCANVYPKLYLFAQFPRYNYSLLVSLPRHVY